MCNLLNCLMCSLTSDVEAVGEPLDSEIVFDNESNIYPVKMDNGELTDTEFVNEQR